MFIWISVCFHDTSSSVNCELVFRMNDQSKNKWHILFLMDLIIVYLFISSPNHANYSITKIALKWEPACYCACLCLCCCQARTCEYYLWCVSSSQCTTRVRPFLSTFNSNLAHYSQTTKALSWHSAAHCSEWWIFPITLLSIQVSGKHRPMETALEEPCSHVCLTPADLWKPISNFNKDLQVKGKSKIS